MTADARGASGADILYVDDHGLLFNADRQFEGHRLLALDSVSSLRDFLDDRPDPKLPPPPHDPQLVLIDLDLGSDRPGGIVALQLLQESWLRDVPVAIVSADNHYHRDLYPILAAEALRRPLLVAQKVVEDLRALKDFADLVAVAPGLLRDDVSFRGLRLVRPLVVTGPQAQSQPRSLTQVLFDASWKPPLWMKLADGARWEDACSAVGAPRDYARAKLGEVISAIKLRGGRLMELGSRLDLMAAHRDPRWDQLAFREDIVTFASRYQRVLSDPHIHSVARRVLATPAPQRSAGSRRVRGPLPDSRPTS